MFCSFPSLVLSQEEDDTTGLGYLQAFSVFVNGDIDAGFSNTRGRMAAAGSVSLESYSVGGALTYQCSRTDLLVGQDLTFKDGQVERGRITYRGTSSLSNVGVACGQFQSSSEFVNFDEIFAKLNNTAYNIDSHLPTGVTSTPSSNTISFKGYLAQKNYFKIDADTIATTTNIYIDIPTNASATISVSGTTVTIQSLSIQISDTTDPQRILWNMFEATTVNVGHVTLIGSILAPHGFLSLDTGSVLGSVAGLSFSGGASIEYSPYIPPDSNCTCIECPPMWHLPPFSIYVYDTISLSNSQDSGRVAAGGDVELQNFSIGSELQIFPITTNSTVVGGNLDFTSGAIYGGNIIVAGIPSVTDVTLVNGEILNTPIGIDFDTQFATLSFNTLYFSKLISNGDVNLRYSTLTLTSSDTGLNVFTLTSADFNAATNLIIDCPATSWAVINVPDVDASLSSIYVELTGIAKNRVIFNFYEATSLTISAVGVEGSILAPNANVQFPSGNINGNLVCKTLIGNGAVYNYLPIPLRPPCPPCLCFGDI